MNLVAAAFAADAQCSLGVRHGSGRCVARDQAESLRWFRMAAEQGRAGAQCSLGYRYDIGEGVAPDKVEAVRW